MGELNQIKSVEVIDVKEDLKITNRSIETDTYLVQYSTVQCTVVVMKAGVKCILHC